MPSSAPPTWQAAEAAQPDGAVALLCTAPSEEVARSLARSLVSARLAACVQLLPGATSVYTWKGELCEDSETLLLIKSRRDLLPALHEALVAAHPYDTPELLSLPVEAGSSRYLAWLRDNTRDA